MSLEFDETGGYDCITGAWLILDSKGKIILRIDQGDFDQSPCDYSYRSPAAEQFARMIFQRLSY